MLWVYFIVSHSSNMVRGYQDGSKNKKKGKIIGHRATLGILGVQIQDFLSLMLSAPPTMFHNFLRHL